MSPTIPVNVRIKADALKLLEKIGQDAAPKPLNRSEMINVAIEDYVRRHEGAAKRKR